MADELLITGQTGLKNVSAEAIRELLSGLAGTGQYVLKGFTCTLNGTTAVNVAGGVALFNGAEVYLKKTGQSVAISAGASGTNRRDLIVLRFTRTSQQDTQKESCSIVYLKGTAASSPKDPTYNTGSILDGTATVDMPIARITWTGVTPTIANIANKLQSADDFQDSISHYVGMVTKTMNNSYSVMVLSASEVKNIIGHTFDPQKDFISLYNANSTAVSTALHTAMKNSDGNFYANFQNAVKSNNVQIGYMITCTK